MSDQIVTKQGSTSLAPWESGEVPAISTTLSAEATLQIINDAMAGADARDKPIKLVDVVCHQVTVNSTEIVDGKETTVESEELRTILVDDKGVGYAFVSKGIIQSLKQLCSLLDVLPPFDPPLSVKIVEKPTGRGFRVYRVVPA